MVSSDKCQARSLKIQHNFCPGSAFFSLFITEIKTRRKKLLTVTSVTIVVICQYQMHCHTSAVHWLTCSKWGAEYYNILLSWQILMNLRIMMLSKMEILKTKKYDVVWNDDKKGSPYYAPPHEARRAEALPIGNAGGALVFSDKFSV